MNWFVRLFRRITFRGNKLPIYGDEGTKYLVYSYYDVNTKEDIVINLLCTCGWNVSEFKSQVEDTFWCEHCDRMCEEGLPTCYFCENLASSDVEAIRAQYNQQAEEDEEDN